MTVLLLLICSTIILWGMIIWVWNYIDEFGMVFLLGAAMACTGVTLLYAFRFL
jgi:hypothetical protein